MAAQLPVFARRIAEARRRAGMSQRGLGMALDWGASVASARINQYEKGRREPDLGTLMLLAGKLEVPTAYFYCDEQEVADMLLALHGLHGVVRREVAKSVVEALAKTKKA